jgi:hypothetical protein
VRSQVYFNGEGGFRHEAVWPFLDHIFSKVVGFYLVDTEDMSSGSCKKIKIYKNLMKRMGLASFL